MKAQQLFDILWKDYTTQNPSAKAVFDLFISKNEKVENDHIAFRTFDDNRVNIDILVKAFLKAGYIHKGDYLFEQKHLIAKHYEHADEKNMPRVFISQLITKDFSPFLQETVKNILDQISQMNLDSDGLIYAGRLWQNPSFEVYEKLRQESEYAAWLYIFGFRANHFTVSINALKTYDSIQKVNNLLIENGYLLNDAGGEIKGSPAELLEQSSIKSEIIEMEFKEGLKKIPACYYEFAKRYPDTNGELYSGFIAKSADKIFESTNYYEK